MRESNQGKVATPGARRNRGLEDQRSPSLHPVLAQCGECPAGSGHAGEVSAVRGGKVASRTGFPGKKQPILHWRSKITSAVSLARESVGVRTARERILAPKMSLERLHPPSKIAAEQSDQIRYSEVVERSFASGFKFARQPSAEISLNQGSAEWPYVISSCALCVDAPKKTTVLFKFFRIRK